jgi:hypothetical protein
VTFLLDNTLAPSLAHSLDQQAGPDHRVTHLKDRFPGNPEDAVWMQAVAKELDVVLVTAGVRLRRNPHAMKAWRETGLMLFILKPGWSDLTFEAQADQLAKCLPALIAEAQGAGPGSGFLVNVSGKVERL